MTGAKTEASTLKFIPTIVQLCRGELKIDSSFGMPMFHLNAVSFSGFNFYFKRIMDVVFIGDSASCVEPVFDGDIDSDKN